MIESADADLFKSFEQNRNLLKGLAIKGQHTAPRFNVAISPDEAGAVAAALVRLSRNITNKHLDEFFDGSRQIIHNNFEYTGKSGWDSALPTLSAKNVLGCPWDSICGTGNGDTSRDNTQCYACKTCSWVEPSTNKDFQCHDLDEKHKCAHCHLVSPVKDWQCMCGLK